jgi:hypothetical protein
LLELAEGGLEAAAADLDGLGQEQLVLPGQVAAPHLAAFALSFFQCLTHSLGFARGGFEAAQACLTLLVYLA